MPTPWYRIFDAVFLIRSRMHEKQTTWRQYIENDMSQAVMMIMSMVSVTQQQAGD